MAVEVFCCYAREDEEWRYQLEKHLSLLKQQGLISLWYDQLIAPGDDRARTIDSHLETASIILLFVSANFFASDNCKIEMERALERHELGTARVIPLLVHPVDCKDAPFAHLQALPTNDKPTTAWSNHDNVFADIVAGLRRIIEQLHPSSPPLSNVQRQNRARLLEQVRETWTEGSLKDSFHQATWIDLRLQEQPDALENPKCSQVQELCQAPRPITAGTSIVEVYDKAHGELLILGKPGSGKTTLLIQLARTLLDRAEKDEHQPMPVVFNLSSWAQKQEALVTWLVEEFWKWYKVPQRVAQEWIKAGQILPLLDGLDEVAEEARGACVEAITAYYSNHPDSVGGLPLVTCCRSEEYQALSPHLPLHHAVSILPLTEEQIKAYLSSSQGQLEGLQQTLLHDSRLYELAHQPLMLSVFRQAYLAGANFTHFSAGLTPKQIQQEVFKVYVEKMLERRKKLQHWKPEQFLHWLSFLAKQVHRHKITSFSVEDLQPNWLFDSLRQYRWSVGLCFGLLFVLCTVLIFGLASMLYPEHAINLLLIGPLVGLLIGLFVGLLTGLSIDDLGNEAIIQPTGIISISWMWKRKVFWTGIILLYVFLPVICLLIIMPRVIIKDEEFVVQAIITDAALTIFLFPILLVMSSISISQRTEKTLTVSNEGIRFSGKQGLYLGLLVGLASGLFMALFCVVILWLPRVIPGLFNMGLGLYDALCGGLIGGLVAGLAFGLACGLPSGLWAFVLHYILRFWLWRKDRLPWNLIPFLNEAADRLLLIKKGDSNYVFTHNLLLMYFVELYQEKSSSSQLSKEQQQHRERLLKQVRKAWIDGVLDQLLHRVIWIDLRLQAQLNVLENSWHLQVLSGDRSLPSVYTRIADIYDKVNEGLLILGEPRSGKTTLLLQLARTLLTRAEVDEQARMPVVFHLSSWVQHRHPLAKWLVEELRAKYHVPREIGRRWINTNQIFPLLDGLDEIAEHARVLEIDAEDARVDCVRTITAYSVLHPSLAGPPLVICCCHEEYQAHSQQFLSWWTASILPLTNAQIEEYLSSTQGQLEELRQALHTDPALFELARQPLMLGIFTLAYQGVNAGELLIGSTHEKTLHTICGRYVKYMLTMGKPLQPWGQEQFCHWLSFLAKQLHQQCQETFASLGLHLQLDWLPKPQQRLCRLSIVVLFVLLGIVYSSVSVFVFYLLLSYVITLTNMGLRVFLGLVLGFVLLVSFVLFVGLQIGLPHDTRRFWLWRTNSLPWRLYPFLNEAVERRLLCRVGWRYCFVHQEIMKYFILEAYKQVPPLNAQFVDDHYDRCNALTYFGRYEEALEAYEQVLSLDPGNAYACSDKGWVLRQLNRYEEALEAYEQALETYEQMPFFYPSVVALNGKGNALYDLGRYEEALRAYEEALTLDPRNVDALNGKDKALKELGRHVPSSVQSPPSEQDTFADHPTSLE